jgi:hypothetical protein
MALPIQRGGGKALPNRVLYYGSPGSCKTTFGAFAPKPLFLISPGETGLLTLSGYGRVPDCDYLEPRSWGELLKFLREIVGDGGDHRTLVLDTVNGLEALCFKAVTENSFGGDPRVFNDFGKGPETAIPEWAKLFAALDAIRASRSMGVVMLAHAGEKKIKNAGGADYLKTVPLIHEKMRHALLQWADIVLFARRILSTKKDGLGHKADFLGALQIIATEGADHEAKNRVGLPPVLDVPDAEPASVFGVFAAAMRAARDAGRPSPKPTPTEAANAETAAAA